MTRELIVQGGTPLRGSVRIKGSKNAGLPIIAASLLIDEPIVIDEVPDLLDVRTMLSVIESLGAEVSYSSAEETIKISACDLQPFEPPEYEMQQMRASFLVLGPLLARFGKARLSLPGGCAIGSRPVDLHLKGLAAMGADFKVSGGLIEGKTERLVGARIYLDYPSVGATENIMMAATLARGQTIIDNAASEPEIVDLAGFLNSAGAKVSGAGTKTIRIEGVKEIGGTRYAVIPDRIEAGTFMISAAVTGGDVTVTNVLPEHLKPLLAKLRETGVSVEELDYSAIRVQGNPRTVGVDLKTLPYPGFPTDLQPQFMVLLAISKGTSLVTETVFENRFMHVDGLMRMNADIQIEGNRAVIQGGRRLSGAPVTASDLRAAAALLLAGLAAEGTTTISAIDYLWRGYSGFEDRLRHLGAKLEIYRPQCLEQAEA
ncbi:MAG: UDP-N-acetylglucosamine 1-carboxyvinyltransferase [Dethiobacteria bacterium]|nr:UDP-N-acetylglucosamine 1-carboxyvinyltransferase [Dethiobacteria bacterium]